MKRLEKIGEQMSEGFGVREHDRSGWRRLENRMSEEAGEDWSTDE